jgi:hypothetical protein
MLELTIREDFGTARLDRVLSRRRSSSAVDTIDDGANFNPKSANPYSTDC